MTKLEAFKHLGIRPTTTPCKEGLLAIRKTAQSLLSQAMKRQTALLDIKAVDALLAGLGRVA